MLNCGKNRTSFDSALFLNMNAGCMGWKFNYKVHNFMKGAATAEKGQFLSHLHQGLFDIYCHLTWWNLNLECNFYAFAVASER